MATVSTLTVDIVAETAKFTNGLKRSRQKTSQWASAVRKATLAAAAGFTAVTGALSLLTRQAFKTADAQQKIADRLGLTQEALAGLTLAAEQTGASQKGLELALQRSTRRIAEAGQGFGSAAGALKELGIEARSFARLSPDEQFIRLAGAFEQVDNQADRVRLGFKLFDSEGVGLINTLRLGEEGLRGFIEQGRQLGVALDRDATRKIEDANDAVNILKTGFRGIGNQLAVQFAPGLRAGAEALTDIITRVVAAIPRIAALTRQFFGLRAEISELSLADVREELRIAQREELEAQGRLNAALREFGKLSKNLQQALIRQAGGTSAEDFGNIRIARKNFEEANKRVNDLIRRLAELKKEAATPIPILGGEGEGAAASTGGPLGAALAVVRERTGIVIDQLAEWRSEADATFSRTRSLVEQYAIDVARVQANPLISGDLQERELERLSAAFNKAFSEMQRGAEQTSARINQFSVQAARNIQQTFADFLFDPFDEGLKGMLRGFVDTLRRMVANLLASQLLTSFFKLFPGGEGLASAAGFATGGPPRALGGPVTAGQPYTVGERGPETFVPGATGRIIPTAGMTFSAVTNINVQGAITPETLIPILEENNRALRGQLLDDIDRGGL